MNITNACPTDFSVNEKLKAFVRWNERKTRNDKKLSLDSIYSAAPRVSD